MSPNTVRSTRVVAQNPAKWSMDIGRLLSSPRFGTVPILSFTASPRYCTMLVSATHEDCSNGFTSSQHARFRSSSWASKCWVNRRSSHTPCLLRPQTYHRIWKYSRWNVQKTCWCFIFARQRSATREPASYHHDIVWSFWSQEPCTALSYCPLEYFSVCVRCAFAQWRRVSLPCAIHTAEQQVAKSIYTVVQRSKWRVGGVMEQQRKCLDHGCGWWVLWSRDACWGRVRCHRWCGRFGSIASGGGDRNPVTQSWNIWIKVPEAPSGTVTMFP